MPVTAQVCSACVRAAPQALRSGSKHSSKGRLNARTPLLVPPQAPAAQGDG